MPRTSPPLLPRLARLLERVGGNLKLARLRRKYSAETVAQRAGISRKTLYDKLNRLAIDPGSFRQ